jgi:hypothetical protein
MEWRGEDTSGIAAEIHRLARAVSDPDADSWPFYFSGLRALLDGQTEQAISAIRRALTFDSQSIADYQFGLALSAHLARDADVAREALDGIQGVTIVGYFVDGIAALAGGGLAALEGRRHDAITGFREAIHAFDRSGNRFYVALTRLDALRLMPDEPTIAEWADEARQRFVILKVPPLIRLLDEATTARVPV